MGIRRGLVATSLLAGLIACGPADTRPEGASSVSATAVGPSSTLDEQAAEDLTRRYVQCVNSAGFALGHAWVLDLPGTGLLVKTEVDVPARIHSPCLRSIGGPPTDRSSWSL